MISEIVKWGFFIYLGIIPLIPDFINSKYRITDAYLILLVCIYIVNMLSNSERRRKLFIDLKTFFKDLIVIFMLLLIVIMGVSTLYSTDKNVAVQETIRFGTYIVVLYYFVSEIDVKKDMNKIITFFYCPAFIVGVLGVIQYFTKIGIEVNTNGVLRIESTLGHPNSLGLYFVLLLFPLIPLILEEKVRKRKILYCMLLVIMIFNIVLCFSRNAWLSLIFGIFILTVIYSWKFVVGLFVAGAGVLLSPPLRARLISLSKAIIYDGRLKHWAIALEMFKDKPLTGVGNGNYVTLHAQYLKRFPQYIVPGEENYPTHNSYFKILCELGVLGFIPFILLHIAIFIRAIKVCKLYSKKYQGLIKGLIVSILIFFQANLFDNMWFVPKVAIIYWIIVGVIILLQRRKIYND